MHLLQNGCPKSGNYWLYKILSLSLDAGGVPQKSFIQNHPVQAAAQNWLLSYPEQAGLDVLDIEPGRNFCRIGSYFREPIDNITDYIQSNRLVWSHSRYIPDSAEVYDKFDKIVYIVRDPRDVAISMAHFAFTPYRLRTVYNPFETPEAYLKSRLVNSLSGCTQHVASHLMAQPRANMHIVFYERLRSDFEIEYAKLVDFLELDVRAAQRAEIQEEVSVKSMKAKSAGHVRSGKSGGWANTLTPQQMRMSKFLAGGLLKELGYPLSASKPGIPALPTALNKSRTRRSMRTGMILRGLNFVYKFSGFVAAPDKARITSSAP